MDRTRALRSLLFVPGNREELYPKAAVAGSDTIVLDLEDAVAPVGKNLARACVAAELARQDRRLTFIRINHPQHGMLAEDLAVLAPHTAQAVMLPKVACLQDIEEVDARLAVFEGERELERDSIAMVVVIETALGLRNLFDIVRRRSRIRGAALASAEEGDLMFDLGGRWTPGGEALAYARGKLVCDARAAGIPWVIDGAFMNLRDSRALEAECRLARNYGFSGKVAIHPRQVPVINDAFSPTAAEIERARHLIEDFRQAETVGRGAIQVRGMMVDAANIRWAERILDLADAIEAIQRAESSP